MSDTRFSDARTARQQPIAVGALQNGAVTAVYRVRSKLDGALYVGISECIGNRWRQHRGAARSGSLDPLHVAIRDFGPDAFEFAVLEWHAERKDAARREAELIVEHDCLVPKGYNQGPGGEGAAARHIRARKLAAQYAKIGLHTREEIAEYRRRCRNDYDRKWYANRALDPDFRARRSARECERQQSSAEIRAARNSRERAKRADPKFRAQWNAKQQEWKRDRQARKQVAEALS